MALNNKQDVEYIELAPGFYWLKMDKPNLRLLGGVPPDAMKYLAAKNMLSPYKLDGFYTEQGPNSLLLNEDLFINDIVANLAEFPILQMFYMQGMGLSFHPNFGKEEPLIIGLKEQIKSQLNYIKYGNNGLNFEEMMNANPKHKKLYNFWYYMKARFAGNVDLLKLIKHKEISGNKRIEIKPKVYLKRIKKNVYEIEYKNQTYKLDLNLKKNEQFKPTYKLKNVKIPKSKFSIINTGTGDGWNHNDPCFGSLINHDSKYYLLDCEVFFQDSLNNFGLDISKLSGIFLSHSHDDHMSGIPIIYNKKIKSNIFATKLVFHSLMKKIMAMLTISEKEFRQVFKHIELKYEKWNDIKGLQVLPLHSAHPIETSIFYMRVKDKNRYKVYAHLGDIAPISIIKEYRKSAITKEESDFYTNMIKNYLKPVDLKKIDIGGGLIHGLVEDFTKDKSKKIILGHYHRKLTKNDLKIGVEQKFGDYDILIP